MKPAAATRSVVDQRDSEHCSAVLEEIDGDSSVAVIDGARADWRSTFHDAIGEFDRIVVVVDGVTDRQTLIDLLSMGFHLQHIGEREVATLDVKETSVRGPQRLFALVGPLATRALGDLPHSYAPDPIDLAEQRDPPVVVSDATPWSHWHPIARRSGGRTLGELSVQAVGEMEARTVAPRIAVDVIGRPPEVIDGPSQRPILVLGDVGMPMDRSVGRTTGPGAALEFHERTVRVEGLRSPNDRPTTRLRAVVRGAGGVVLPAAAFRSALDRAVLAVVAGACGIPVVADEIEALQPYLGPETLGLLGEFSSAEWGDALQRDHAGVRLYRAICREHSDAVVRALLGGRTLVHPTVTAVLSTVRPHLVSAALRLIRAQTVPVEVVLILHGVDADDSTVERWREEHPGPLEILRIPGDVILGDVLNMGVERASGEVVNRWDDDDWYAPEHIEDLLWALRTSHADLVGKGAEFFYLEGRDLTLQRSPDGRWRYSIGVAGSNVTLHRSILRELGGFPGIAATEDRALVERIADSGGRVFRLHGYGYLVHRAVSGHTWDPGDAYFIGQSVRQWAGRATIEAGVEPGRPRPSRRY